MKETLKPSGVTLAPAESPVLYTFYGIFVA